MPSRLWLDATESDQPSSAYNNEQKPDAPSLPLLSNAPPVIPPRNPRASLIQSRRRSVGTTRKYQDREREKERSQQSGPAPEVISDLIDSFATGSFSDLADTGSRRSSRRSSRHLIVTPSAPAVRHVRSFDGDTGTNFSRDYGTLRTALQQDLALTEIDDAAEPPIVRTSKPPSGFSSVTAAKPVVRDSLRSQWRSTAGSQSVTSLYSVGSQDDVRSIGTVSIERRRSSVVTPTRESFDSQTSPRRTQKVLSGLKNYKSGNSSDHEGRGHRDQPVNGINGDVVEYLYLQGTASPPRSPSLLGHPILEEVLSEPATIPAGSKREGKKPFREGKMGSPNISQGPMVPNRRSSLRHQDIPTPARTRSHSPQPRAGSNPRTRMPEEEPKTLTAFGSLDGEDTEVTKRIKELKAKKEQRDRESRESPTPKFPNSSLLAPPSSRTPAKIPKDESTLSSHKLRKSPGLTDIHVAPATSTQMPDLPPSPLTPTPLPINYSFVVQSLDNESRPPSRSSLTRRLSAVVGGRSAVARATEKATVRETIPLGSDERQSLDSRTHQQRSATRPRRPSSSSGRKKRWSHPDLPFGLERIERRSSMKGSDQPTIRSGANPASPVAEERPSSRDSIDQKVDSFLYSQRLSQKIRHPETGRIISFSEVGDPKGNVVFCCVGMGLTRFVTAFYDELAATLKLRLVTPDRPGVGDSQTDANGTPLSWPDDVLLICSALNITKFSILAHSAGAIYALATALRIPQHIRGKVHLLAPWIPPSQMEPIGLHQDPPPAAQLPKSQRFLRALPAPLLKVANSSFLSATSASLTPNLGSPAGGRKKRKSNQARTDSPSPNELQQSQDRLSKQPHQRNESIMLMDQQMIPNGPVIPPRLAPSGLSTVVNADLMSVSAPATKKPKGVEENVEFHRAYDERLTLCIWANATTNANPAVDLLVCLERSQAIGFRYVDITRAVVIHHGSKDSRVPLENVKWLGNMMRRCEVRVLEGEGHGLMASASVMGSVLTEMAKEWEDWFKVVGRGRGGS